MPCNAPQIINFKLAPCQNPPSNIVVIKFTLVNIVLFLSLANKKVKQKTKSEAIAITKGIGLMG